MAFELFPAELCALPQWCVATLLPNAEGKADKAPHNPVTGRAASTTDPKTWGTLEQALTMRDAWRSTTCPRAQIGFVFNEGDPFAVIDLDTYKAKDDDVRDGHARILAVADTYAELSQSGLGTHIIGRGIVATGINHAAGAFELYSHARFMICTGNPVDGLAKPLDDIQDILDYLAAAVSKTSTDKMIPWRDLGPGEDEVLEDSEVFEMAMNADNGDKFDRLCCGDMSDYHDDWSKADAALLEFLCFYSPNNEQVRRLFMASALGKRDKATQRPDYVPRTIAFVRSRLEQEAVPDVDASAILERAKALTATPEPAPIHEEPEGPAAPVSASDAAVTFPPGLIGEVAEYVMSSAQRPVREIALVAAIGMIAGIVGRQYNTTTGSGLNQYILLLAKTGTGKEAPATAMDKLFAAIQKASSPQADRFIGPAVFASGQALVKVFQDQKSFVSVLSEFGATLKTMVGSRVAPHNEMLRKALLEIYSKSGFQQTMRPSVYSDKEKNTALVHAPCLTLLCENEPEGFFASLDESMISSGLLPRFLIVEYTGERPGPNKFANHAPDPALVTRLADLCTVTLKMEQDNVCTEVGLDADAKLLFERFSDDADNRMRGSDDVTRHLWNRAHLMALRLASLVAVGVNQYNPIVVAENARWAIALVERSVATLLDRFKAGDVGEGDSKLHADVERHVARYYKKQPKQYEHFIAKGCLPIRYLQIQTWKLAAFQAHKQGSARALTLTLESLVKSGVLQKLAAKNAFDWFKTTSDIYMLGDQWGK